jgi:methylsterol monooxygenase
VYWGLGAFYIFLDVTNKPAFLRRYKVQPETNEPVDRSKLKKVIIKKYFIVFKDFESKFIV